MNYEGIKIGVLVEKKIVSTEGNKLKFIDVEAHKKFIDNMFSIFEKSEEKE